MIFGGEICDLGWKYWGSWELKKYWNGVLRVGGGRETGFFRAALVGFLRALPFPHTHLILNRNPSINPTCNIRLTNLAKPYHVHFHLSQPEMAGPRLRLRRGAYPPRRSPGAALHAAGWCLLQQGLFYPSISVDHMWPVRTKHGSCLLPRKMWNSFYLNEHFINSKMIPLMCNLDAALQFYGQK